MADVSKGIHAGLTFFVGIIALYLTWDMWTSVLNTISEEPIHSMLWLCFIGMHLVALIVIPLLIATAEDDGETHPTLFSAAGMYGYTIVAIFIGRIAWPIFDSFSSILEDGYSISFVGFLVLLYYVMTLFVMPIVIGAFPGLIEEPAKKALQKAIE